MDLGSITLEQALDLLKAYWEEAKQAPMVIWKWTESYRMYRGIAIGAAVLFAVLAVYLVFALFRGGWKGLFRNLLFIAVGFTAICATLIMVEREVARSLPSEETAVQLAAGEAIAGSRYSLARGDLAHGTKWGSMTAEANWKLTDNTFTLPIGDDLILQLTGLGRPEEDARYYIREIRRSHGGAGIEMQMSYDTAATDNSNQTAYLYSAMEIWAIPDRRLSKMPWYGAAGTVTPDSVLVEDGMVYGEHHVLENDWETLILATDCGQAEEGQRYAYLVLARQTGPDILCCAVQCAEYMGSIKESRSHYYDPLNRPEDRDALLDMAENMMKNTKMLRGLSAEEREAVLPHTLADFPVGASWRNGGFEIPCTELLEMRAGEDYRDKVITLIGELPDGKQGLYTLLNTTGWVDRWNTGDADPAKAEQYHEWETAFAEGEELPDPEMTAFLGAPAVAWGEGWLLNPGPFYGEYDGQAFLYYLTAKPLS